MKEKLMNLLKNAKNVETRKQFLFAYLNLVDSVEQQAEDLATIVDSLFTVTDFYKDELTKLLKNQKEADSEEPYNGMTRRGDDGTWERYSASDKKWCVPLYEFYDEDAGEWVLDPELDSEELDDYE